MDEVADFDRLARAEQVHELRHVEVLGGVVESEREVALGH